MIRDVWYISGKDDEWVRCLGLHTSQYATAPRPHCSWRHVSTTLLVVEDDVYRAQAHVKLKVNCNVGRGEFENLLAFSPSILVVDRVSLASTRCIQYPSQSPVICLLCTDYLGVGLLAKDVVLVW